MSTFSRVVRNIGSNRKSEPSFDPVTILAGLSPRLVIDLAKLAGSTVTDLEVTFQLMPWGDRATLAAYGVLEMSGQTDAPGRRVHVRPIALAVVDAAAELIAQAATPRAVAEIIREELDFCHTGLNPHPVQVVSPVELEESPDPVVSGVVQGVAATNGSQILEVEVDDPYEVSSADGGAPYLVLLAASAEPLIVRKSRVRISYKAGLPQTVAPVK